MAEYERKHGDFTLFEQTTKKSEKHPDFNGKILLNGKEHWISGWKKTSKSGDRFISGNIGKAVEGASTPAPKGKNNSLDSDDIPW